VIDAVTLTTSTTWGAWGGEWRSTSPTERV
jgi:hypothetical protein